MAMDSMAGSVPELTLFAGRFGSGKTEAAIAYAIRLASGNGSMEDWKAGRLREPFQPSNLPTYQSSNSVLLVDLDIVTPFFRTRDTAEAMQGHGVQVVAPAAVSRHLDLPAISPQILGAIEQRERPVVVDVGGDPQGARALGQFRAAISSRPYTMHFVINPYRPFTGTLDELRAVIAEIEATSRLKVTSLISNPNLIYETTVEVITEGHARIERIAEGLGLPIAFLCIERRWLPEFGANHFRQPLLVLDRYFVMAWE